MVNLELNKYLDERGKKRLKYDPKVVINDPFGVEEKLLTVKQAK
jgi:nitrite reductase (cytochrome c-552)